MAPGNVSIDFGSTGNQLSWTISDAKVDSYIVYKDGSFVEQGPYVKLEPLYFDVDGSIFPK